MPANFGKVDAERRVGDALRQQRQHDQPGHDERAVADAVDLRRCASRSPRRRRRNRARSRSPARRCSASACAACAPSRSGRSRGSRGGSCVLPHQAHEDVLERALRRLQVLEADARLVEVVEQRGDARSARPGCRRCRSARCRPPDSSSRSARAPRARAASGCCSCSVSCFLPSLRISSALSSTRMISPLLMTPMRSAISSASSM